MNVRHKNVCECYETGNWIPLNSNRLLLELAIRPLTMLSPVFVFSIFFRSIVWMRVYLTPWVMATANCQLIGNSLLMQICLRLWIEAIWLVYLLTYYIKLPGFCVEALYLNVCRYIFSCSPIAHWWCQTTQIFYDYYSLLFFMFLFSALTQLQMLEQPRFKLCTRNVSCLFWYPFVWRLDNDEANQHEFNVEILFWNAYTISIPRQLYVMCHV